MNNMYIVGLGGNLDIFPFFFYLIYYVSVSVYHIYISSRKTKYNEIRIQFDRDIFLSPFPIKEIRNICAYCLARPTPTSEPYDCYGNFTRCSQLFLLECCPNNEKTYLKVVNKYSVSDYILDN